MEDSPKFAVFGGGSWATAIVKMLCENLDQVGWYMRNVDAIQLLFPLLVALHCHWRFDTKHWIVVQQLIIACISSQ